METLPSIISHYVTTAGVLSILALLLKQHGIWLRLKERSNILWRDRCLARNDEYVPVEKASR